MKTISALWCIITLFASHLICGCAATTNAAINTVIDVSAADRRESKHPDKVIVYESGGSMVVLNQYQIDNDTLYGHREDYSGYRIVRSRIIKIVKYDERLINKSDSNGVSSENMSRSEARINNEERMKNYGLLFICLASGMAIGAGVGAVVPLTDEIKTSSYQAEKFLSVTGGMLLGGMFGYIVYIMIKNEK